MTRAIDGWRAYALLTLLSLVLYLPGLAAMPPTDRDESRFVQASRQMLESDDFLRIRFQDEPRNKKPAGIYWLQAASVDLLSTPASTAMWPYRLPSLLGALAAVLLTFGFGQAWIGREAAFWGAALLAASLGLTVEAHLAKTDAVLLATVVAAQGALGEIYRKSRNDEPTGAALPLLFWIAQGVGFLIKGPVTPLASLLAGGALALADRDARWLRGLRFLWGVPLALLIAGPWLIAIMVATEGGFASDSVGNDLLAKLIHGQESHGAPPGTYLLAALVTFWPGSMALAGAARLAWCERKETAIRFLVAWIVPFWLLMEIIPTKLPHYVLPAYPALALLAGRALVDGIAARRHWSDLVAWSLWGLVALGLGGALLALPMRLAGTVPVAGAVAIAIALVLAGAALLRCWWGQPRPWLGLAAAAAMWAGGFGLIVPGIDALWLSRSAAALVNDQARVLRPVVVAGYAEPSLVFLLGTATKLTGGPEAAAILSRLPETLVLVSNREDAAFRAALQKESISVDALGEVSGLNYSNGRAVTLTLYEVAR
ncbi:MAG TPA: glycosyltransferase family 39 protein [Stellaceae bacterium]|nr:glycosyltransferase family 39 protein [Stellaceae bacterium]